MPILDMRFEDGIFYCREEGKIDENDAHQWAQHAAYFASKAQYPIVALVDATEATYVTAAARSVFARASAIPNLHDAAIAVGNVRVKSNAQLTAMLAVDKHTQIFDRLDAAVDFAKNRARLLRDLSTGV